MRLDKFLKISLIFKTRSAAEKAIENCKITLNHKQAKPSSSIKIGDIIIITSPLKKITYQVEQLFDKSVPRQVAREMTTVLNEEKYEI